MLLGQHHDKKHVVEKASGFVQGKDSAEVKRELEAVWWKSDLKLTVGVL